MEYYLQHKPARHMAHDQGSGEAIGSSRERRLHHQHVVHCRPRAKLVTGGHSIWHLQGGGDPFDQGAGVGAGKVQHPHQCHRSGIIPVGDHKRLVREGVAGHPGGQAGAGGEMGHRGPGLDGGGADAGQ